jgi:hypothetical protein
VVMRKWRREKEGEANSRSYHNSGLTLTCSVESSTPAMDQDAFRSLLSTSSSSSSSTPSASKSRFGQQPPKRTIPSVPSRPLSFSRFPVHAHPSSQRTAQRKTALQPTSNRGRRRTTNLKRRPTGASTGTGRWRGGWARRATLLRRKSCSRCVVFFFFASLSLPFFEAV